MHKYYYMLVITCNNSPEKLDDIALIEHPLSHSVSAIQEISK